MAAHPRDTAGEKGFVSVDDRLRREAAVCTVICAVFHRALDNGEPPSGFEKPVGKGLPALPFSFSSSIQ
jgi:hypothetical protein